MPVGSIDRLQLLGAGSGSFNGGAGDNGAVADAAQQHHGALSKGAISLPRDGGGEAGEVEAEDAHGSLLDEQTRTCVLFRQ